MLRKLFPVLLILALAIPGALASDLWLHVKVDEGGEDGERVRVNIPLSLVEQLLPLVPDKHFTDGKIRLDDEILGLDDEFEMDRLDLVAMWEAIRNTTDGEYVTVDSRRENVRVAKKDGMFLINVTENDDGAVSEKVQVRIPMTVFDALFSAGETELDIAAALKALGEYKGDLVTVEEQDTTVRVWVDGRQEID